MLEVAEPAGDAAAEFDDPVDGFSATVARAIGVEVGQERGLPAALGLPQPRDLGDRAGWQGCDQLLGQAATCSGRGLVEHLSNLLGAVIGDLDRDVLGVCGERCIQPCLLPLGEAFSAGAEDVPDPVERIARTPPMAERPELDLFSDPCVKSS